MAGVTQEEFVGRVREALRDRGKPVALPDDLEIARVIRADVDLPAVFCERVVQAGMRAHQVPDEQAMVRLVLALLEELEARSVLVPDEAMPGRGELVKALELKGLKFYDAENRDAAFEADAGITGAALAIAETGSVVVTSGGGRRRLASLAVPIHIALVRADQIVADMVDWPGRMAEYLQAGDLPASEVLISGPSKTADIEMTLVTGVHGPKHVHIIVVG
jgi:L-lactate utilization protein LutC